jgi:hypothetical protein
MMQGQETFVEQLYEVGGGLCEVPGYTAEQGQLAESTEIFDLANSSEREGTYSGLQ